MRYKIIYCPDIPLLIKEIRDYSAAWRNIAHEVNIVMSGPQDKIRLDYSKKGSHKDW